jgi:hypothetical protein
MKEKLFGNAPDLGRRVRKFGVAPNEGVIQYTMYGTSY